MDENNAANEQDDELDWETQTWADAVHELIYHNGKSYSLPAAIVS